MNGELKSILILGNGFDLAHGLPTKYIDFLNFCKAIVDYSFLANIPKVNYSFEGVNTVVNEKLNDLAFKTVDSINWYNDIVSKLTDDFWYYYLSFCYSNNLLKGENWIDFETEISFIIQWLDKKVEDISIDIDEILIEDYDILSKTSKMKLEYIKELIQKLKRGISFTRVESNYHDKVITVRHLRLILYNDLIRMVELLELYLTYFIKDIDLKPIHIIQKLKPDFVLSFNYTRTYEKIYGDVIIQHIHGVVAETIDEIKEQKKSNLVLGINEYLEKDIQQDKTNFSIFKKFVQRIINNTGNLYKQYLDEIEKKDELKKNEVLRKNKYSLNDVFIYILGHSLDISDKDILKDFIASSSTVVTIYCLDEFAKVTAIENVIRLVGEDILIEKSLANPTRIKFEILNN